jgi:hypothetical protein
MASDTPGKPYPHGPFVLTAFRLKEIRGLSRKPCSQRFVNAGVMVLPNKAFGFISRQHARNLNVWVGAWVGFPKILKAMDGLK